ncbi:MAG: sigma 54-interacting transcriptional regulator [Planctomycetes bacterium]|nr:sigma 54-interacting transcriptional regulator [Planctomycetota bacterium]
MSDERELLWLRRVRDLSQALADETRAEDLLPLILDSAIEITEAERGYLVRVTGRQPDGRPACRVESARGFSQTRLRSAEGDVSRTVVQRVLDSGEGLVTTREEDADVLEVSSVQANRVVSILCVPLRLRGEVRGVLYLDHRLHGAAFSTEDLPILRTFADQAALALETAELRADAARMSESLRELERLTRAPRGAEAAPRALGRFGALVGSSPVMCGLFEQLERAARSSEPVLLLGETGVGKALVARELHARGELPKQPFVVQGCAAVTDEQLEAELFGQARQGPNSGALVRAERGTLVLDDVAELSPVMQGKLVAVLRDGQLTLAGSAQRVRVACRVVAITRHDLLARVEAGDFREDLYYRLDVQRIRVPALRERPGDVPDLIEHFAGRRLAFTENALSLLCAYAWPGNVRELRNEVRRLAELDVEVLSARQLSEQVRAGRGVSRASGTLAGKTLGEVERAMIEAALREAQGNKAKAARQLGIPRSTLYGLLQRYDLEG